MPTSTQRTVLVIDDEPVVRDFLRDALEAFGYVVDVAASGIDGLARFAATRHAVVLTDLKMPGWSGWQVIEHLRTIDPHVPAVIITGHATPGDIERANREHLTLLEKPVSLERLAATMEIALNRPTP